MDRGIYQEKGFIHPSRAHLFQKTVSAENNQFGKNSGSVKIQHVSRTWNNRRDQVRENQTDDDLLVFGYACKIFPPNEHSAAIARNKHLIAWNEDHALNLLIDRYDCRASLHNLTEFDGDAWNKNYQLSEEEFKLEEHLDEERYRAIYVEELEENIRQEEEIKRLHASIAGNSDDQKTYGEVGYQYEKEQEDQYDPCDPTNDDEEELQKPFIAPSCLAVPKEMEIPATEKMHAIIEKTATFVSQQGAQMEIVLKAKQAKNSQFQFLQFGHYLNPYYKHMVKRLKEGKYAPGLAQKENEENSDEDSDSSDEDGNYLHPSLFASSHQKEKETTEDKTKAIRTVDPDHPLAKLIEKGRQANAIKQYQKMAQTVYYYQQQQQQQQLVLNDASHNSNNVMGNVEPPPLPSFMSMNSDYGITNPVYQSEYQSDTPPPPGEETTQAIAVPGSNHVAGVTLDSWQRESFMVPPPPDLQSVVEEIAKKVATEGEAFEKSLVSQNNSSYMFLLPWHELHPYYQFRKVSWHTALHPPPPPEVEAVKKDTSESLKPSSNENVEEHSSVPPGEDAENQENDSKIVIPAAPISFSIKPRKEGTKKPLPVLSSSTSVVLGEEESEEENNAEQNGAEPQVAKVKNTKRKFTDEPLTSIQAKVPKHASPPSSFPIKPLVTLPKMDIVPRAPKIIVKSMPTSSFTAVTPSGESASINDLRQKQATRRQKALLFLKAKNQQEAAQKIKHNAALAKAAEEQKKLATVASEDIFDMFDEPSSPSEAETTQITPENEQTPPIAAPTKAIAMGISKLEILQKLVSTPSSRSSTPLSSSGRHKRSRSRSRSRSLAKDSQEENRSRDSPNSKLKSSRRTSSPDEESSSVPSAYRYENTTTKRENRSSNDRTRSSRRDEDDRRLRHRESKQRLRDRERPKSSRSSKHRRTRKHSTNDERKKKKKKQKKRKKKTKQNSSSSDDATTSTKSRKSRKRDKDNDQHRGSEEEGELVSDKDLNEGSIVDDSAEESNNSEKSDKSVEQSDGEIITE